MRPWCALCVALTLLRALEAQTPNPQATISSVVQSFREDQFQGEWFVLGLAGSDHRKADRSLLNPFTATFERNEKSRLEVSYAMTRRPAAQPGSRTFLLCPSLPIRSPARGQRCVTWSYVLIPATQPGKFSVDNSGVPGADPEEVLVYDTDYTTFALMLSRRQSGSREILRVNLLCRTWAIQTQVLSKFVCLVRAQGLSDNNIVFPDLTGNKLLVGQGLDGGWASASGPQKPCGSPAGGHSLCSGSACGVLVVPKSSA
ncbi:epididymal-specific lipocalin-12 isoform X1 [Equus caballus]|uniref:epididymal-specific lipocalin-12 isoform X1 n=1 Tax=Equus caballus TaxID=9796 RepID=UPI0038B29A2E